MAETRQCSFCKTQQEFPCENVYAASACEQASPLLRQACKTAAGMIDTRRVPQSVLGGIDHSAEKTHPSTDRTVTARQ